MNINNEYIYSTHDLSEGSLLLTKNQKLIRLERVGGTVFFIFADKNRCKELSDQFWFGECLVDAKSYFEAIQTLKNRIFAS